MLSFDRPVPIQAHVDGHIQIMRNGQAYSKDRPGCETRQRPTNNHETSLSSKNTILAVAIPVPTTISVAVIDRTDNRAIPHTPCPLVQPLPSRVPKPTSTPAIIS